jgi:hypothetical protein
VYGGVDRPQFQHLYAERGDGAAIRGAAASAPNTGSGSFPADRWSVNLFPEARAFANAQRISRKGLLIQTACAVLRRRPRGLGPRPPHSSAAGQERAHADAATDGRLSALECRCRTAIRTLLACTSIAHHVASCRPAKGDVPPLGWCYLAESAANRLGSNWVTAHGFDAGTIRQGTA